MEAVVVDCSTRKESRRPLTAKEKAARAAFEAAFDAETAAEAARVARLAALRAKGAASFTPAELNETIDLLLGR